MRHVHSVSFALALATAAISAVPAVAQDFNNELRARQGEMRIMSLNLGILGGMVQGKMDYDAELAQIAADNLVTVSQINQAPFWPEGSDSFSIENSRAEPTIWDDYAAFMASWTEFGEAAVTIQAAAAGGVEALGPAIRTLGASCQGCHDDFQTPR